MTGGDTVLAKATSDKHDRLVRADELLATLQIACGGEPNGIIAIPALLELVRRARHYRLKLARPVYAQDASHAITAWIEVDARQDGEAGCDILVRNWRATPLPSLDNAALDSRRRDLDRELAELTARLDANQRLLAVTTDAPDLNELVALMRDGAGQRWTAFVSIEGHNRDVALHWRLLDGVKVAVPGSERIWRASLFPQQSPGAEPVAFELCLTAEQPMPDTLLRGVGAEAESQAAMSRQGLVGRDIAPVLRQPIARIIANAETIRSRLAGPLPEEYANYAGDIAAAGKHLLALIDDLADLEVVEADDFSTEPDRIDLAAVARQAVGILGVRARERGIVVEAPQLDAFLPAIGEFRRVLQVLLNLVGNAIRYTAQDSRIWIRLEERNGRSRVIVADQGPGLSDADQARIFEKFERLGRSGDGGSGLGLYISRRLARAMAGDLTVESAPGEGARFILELPGAESEDLPIRAHGSY